MGGCKSFWCPTGPKPAQKDPCCGPIGCIQQTSQENSPFNWIFINFFCTCISAIVLALSLLAKDEVNQDDLKHFNACYNAFNVPLWFYQAFSLLMMGGHYPRDVFFMLLECITALAISLYCFYELTRWDKMADLTDTDRLFVAVDILAYTYLTLRSMKLAYQKKKGDRLPS